MLQLRFCKYEGSQVQRLSSRNVSFCLWIIMMVSLSTFAMKPDLSGMKRDTYVQAAPLIVVATCRDGVAIIAAHTMSDQEPLLYYSYEENVDDDDDCEEGETAKANDDNDNLEGKTSVDSGVNLFKNLPEGYGGPFRIQHVDASTGATLLCAGWRADCEALVRRCRAVVANEDRQLGRRSSSCNSNDRAVFGRFVAIQLSQYLAQRVVSGYNRPLSCVGLLVTPGVSAVPEQEQHACVWLVDATGAYPVRAHCLGGGTMVVKGDDSDNNDGHEPSPLSVSDYLNARLGDSIEEFRNLSVQQGAKRLIQFLSSEEENDNSEKAIATASAKRNTQPLLAPGTRLEIAVLESSKKQMRRMNLSFLFGDDGD